MGGVASGRTAGVVLVEPAGPERLEERAGLAADDLVREQLPGDEAEGRAAVGEGDVVAGDLRKGAEHRLAVAGDRLGAHAAGLGGENGITRQHRRRLTE